MKVRRYLATLMAVVALLVFLTVPVSAATTADVTVQATPAFVGITDNATTYDFGVVATSSTTNSTTDFIGITTASTVQTDVTISVTTANWTGGVDWIHSNTATAEADTVGLNSQRGGVWGASVVVVESDVGGTPNFIYENCPATTNFDYGISLKAPTSFSDGVQKVVTLRISAVAG